MKNIFLIFFIFLSIINTQEKDMKAPRGYLNNTFIKWSAMLGWLDLVNTKPEIPDSIEVFSDLEFKKTEHRTLLLDIYRSYLLEYLMK